MPNAEPLANDLQGGGDGKIAGGSLIPKLLQLARFLAGNHVPAWGWILAGFSLYFLPGFCVFLVLPFCFLGLLLRSFDKAPLPFKQSSTVDILLGKATKVSNSLDGLVSNNNVTITTLPGEKYVLVYRHSDMHFPSDKSSLICLTSTDLVQWTQTWEQKKPGCDLREPLLFSLDGRVFLYFFSLVGNMTQFTPQHIYCTTSKDAVQWTEPEERCRKGEVPWDIKCYTDEATGKTTVYKASYIGDHYGVDEVFVLWEKSADGMAWGPVGEDSVVYTGGVCEVAFEFTKSGDMVAVGRNEDGDATGFGSQFFFAPKDNLGTWTQFKVSVPYRFDSPRMMRTPAGEVLLFSRYTAEQYQLAPDWFSLNMKKVTNLVLYSLLPKGGAIYRFLPHDEWDPEDKTGPLEFIRLLEPSAGDTGFFSVTPALSGNKDDWVLANYSSFCHSHANWIYAQYKPTDIYVCRLRTDA